MARFRYTAFDAAGRRVSSEMEAASAKEVLERLEAAGLAVESIQPLHARDSDESASDETASDESSEIKESPRRVSDEEPAEPIFETLHRRDFEELTGHVADLTQSDLPLAQGLRAVADDLPNGRFRRGLLQIAAELERGMDLDRVLALHGAPADVRALLKIGRRTGRTTEVLGEYIIHLRNVADVRRRAVLGLAYPLVLLAVALGIFLAFLCFLVPSFEQLYSDFGVELPEMTVSLIVLSRNCAALAIGLFLLAVGIVVGYLLLPERWRQWVLSHVPVIGPMLRWTALARFT
ncbi:MAG: type II secretion system F family protein, partial [Planctomycetaceae bacterium]